MKTAFQPPADLDESGLLMWESVVNSGVLLESDEPLLREAFRWFVSYRIAFEKWQMDLQDSRLRMAATHSFEQFSKCLKMLGCEPGKLKGNDRKAAELLAEKQAMRRTLLNSGKEWLAKELELCGYDPSRHDQWLRGIVDDNGHQVKPMDRAATAREHLTRFRPQPADQSV